MPAIARVGDPSSHGGSIISASSNVTADGKFIARHGDNHSCPIHGVSSLTSIKPNIKVNGRGVITVGATAGCGAVITAGSPTVFVG